MSDISITEEGKLYDKSKYFSGSQILNHDYQDKLTNIFINSHCSLNWGERIRLADNIHNVRKIFSEHIDKNINSMWIGVFDIEKLDTDEFKKRGIQEGYWKNSIHVKFGDVQDKVLVYSWLDINQFSQDEWNNLLSELDKDHKVDFIGTGPLTFKYKDFNYRVYPPLFGSSDDKKSFLNDTEVFSFSPTGISQIIEDIKESHQSIKKKIASYYESLGKDFAENNKGYIEIKAGIDRNDVKNFTDVSYINRSDNIHNNPIEEAFVKEEERYKAGDILHEAVYMNREPFLKGLLGNPSYDVNKVNENDRTPLHLAAKYGRVGMVEMLLDKEAKVDVVDSRGRTPLHLAAQYNEKKEIVEMLLNKGAKVDIADNRGRTPLHLAAANDHKEVVEVLLKAEGINVNIKDEDGKTPFDLTTNEEIKTLFQKAAESPDAGLIDEPSTDNSGSGTPQTQQGTTSAGQGTDVQDNGVNHVASIEPAQTEEQPSSFFGSLFSILMKPFSLIASFFGGFFSWLFGSNEEKIDESTSQTDASVSLPKLDSLDEKKIDAQPGNHSSLAPNQSAGQADAQQLGADDNQLLG